jgi:hypothetical protein
MKDRKTIGYQRAGSAPQRRRVPANIRFGGIFVAIGCGLLDFVFWSAARLNYGDFLTRPLRVQLATVAAIGLIALAAAFFCKVEDY